ncbi:MAG: protein jag [Dehalococcoidia bacterium]|nr:protein jag [Dehalococcoidia bacterium]
MKELEISAKTVEDALAVALLELGVSRDQVEVEIIKKGRAGIFGVGAEDAKIKVKVIEAPATALSTPDTGQEAGARPIITADDKVEQVATEVLRTLLRLMNIKAQVRTGPGNAGAAVTLDIQGDNLGSLIGRRGQTLASLQFLVRLIVSERLGKWFPIAIDVSGYKQQRRESLRRLALTIAEQVKSTKRAIAMEPMPADERRIVHLTLANHPDVTTHSVGEGDARKVVIQLKKR